MERTEVRLRCIEAAARFPTAHPEGPAAGVLELAGLWAEWVFDEQKYGGPAAPYVTQGPRDGQDANAVRPKLGLPKK